MTTISLVLACAQKEQAQRCQQSAKRAQVAAEAILYQPAYTRRAQGYGHADLARLESERDDWASLAHVWARGCWVTVTVRASVADGADVGLLVGES